jgi:hypothetical protein
MYWKSTGVFPSMLSTAPKPLAFAGAANVVAVVGLKAGEYADFIVLSNDITKIPPSQYTKVTVLQTVVGDRTVYSGNQSAFLNRLFVLLSVL